MSRSHLLASATACIALCAAPISASAAIVSNGDFETGTLSGWQVYNSTPPTGNWFVYSGTSSPENGTPVIAPPQGRYAAITDQGGPGLHILYQDVTLPASGSQDLLSVIVYYESNAPLTSRSTLDPNVMGANQQYRIDVMRPEARIDSMAGHDILATAFQTSGFDPLVLSPTPKTIFVPIAFAGRSVRLRFAEVDNSGSLNAGADVVEVRSNGFTVGNAHRNKKNGTARVPVVIPNPGRLTVSGKSVKAKVVASPSATVAGETVQVRVSARGKLRQKLNETGKAAAKLSIAFTPSGLNPYTRTAKVKLKKKT
jgi:hypothetical protein